MVPVFIKDGSFENDKDKLDWVRKALSFFRYSLSKLILSLQYLP